MFLGTAIRKSEVSGCGCELRIWFPERSCEERRVYTLLPRWRFNNHMTLSRAHPAHIRGRARAGRPPPGDGDFILQRRVLQLK